MTRDLITQLHLTGGLPEGPTANEEILKKLDLQHADSTLQQLEDVEDIKDVITGRQIVHQGQCLILGDSGVGKTSLVKSLTGKPFDPRQPKTQGIDQCLVDEKWTNLSMTDLILDSLFFFLFYHKIRIRLNLYGHAVTNYVLLDDPLRSLCFLCTWNVPVLACLLFSNPECLIITPNFYLFLYLCLVFIVPWLINAVLLYPFNHNYHFRLIVAIFYFIVRRRGLLIGAFPVYVFMLEFYHYGKISVNADGILLMTIIAGLSFVAVIFISLMRMRIKRDFGVENEKGQKLLTKFCGLLSGGVSCPFFIEAILGH